MKEFCENQYGDNLAAREVLASTHRTMAARDKPARPHLERSLKKGGFVIVIPNDGDPSSHGPLDPKLVRPVSFGVTARVPGALDALDLQLKSTPRCSVQDRQAPPFDRCRES